MSSDILHGISIDDPTNLAGMSILIDTDNIDESGNFDVGNLERELMNNNSYSDVGGLTPSEEYTKKIQNYNDFNDDDINGVESILQSLEELSTPKRKQNTLPSINENETISSVPRLPDIEDNRLKHMTNEERRQNVINAAFHGMKEPSSAIFTIEQEQEADEKARKLEQISSILTMFKEEGEEIDRIPELDESNSIDEIDSVLKHLLLKNDRKRYGAFAEECIMLAAHGIEWVFDGEKTYFGFRPNMTDWHKTVKHKLRRMRHDTSTVVGTVMKKWNLGSGTRIALELIPSAFLYSRLKKSQQNDDILANKNVTDDEFDEGINFLRDLE